MTILPPDDRLARLERMVEKGFDDSQRSLAGLDTRLRNLENTEASYRVGLDIRMANCEKEQKEQEVCITKIETTLDQIVPWVNGLRWVVGILGASVFVLVWGLITGQIQLIFIK